VAAPVAPGELLHESDAAKCPSVDRPAAGTLGAAERAGSPPAVAAPAHEGCLRQTPVAAPAAAAAAAGDGAVSSPVYPLGGEPKPSALPASVPPVPAPAAAQPLDLAEGVSRKYQLTNYLKPDDCIALGFFDGGRIGGLGDRRSVAETLVTTLAVAANSMAAAKTGRELISVCPSNDERLAATVGFARVLLTASKGSFH
jgi:hypothetical protein